MMRFTFVFSYWIFIWYLLYIFGATTYNPKIALVIGVIHNITIFLIMLYYKNDWIHLITFLSINLCIKGIPLWTVRYAAYQWKDFHALVIYFMIYIGWLHLNKQLHTSGLELLLKIKANEPVGPFAQFVDKYVKVWRV